MRYKRSRLSTIKHRRQYQHDFMKWFAENRHLFAVEPLKPKATVRYVDLRFPNMSSVLSIHIRASELIVAVTWKKQSFDQILWLDINPAWNGSAYRCRLCEESDETFENLATMRSDHLFAPFLKWCNEELLTSHWLKMEMMCGCTSAKLLREISGPIGMEFSGWISQLRELKGQPMCGDDEKIHIFHLPLFERGQYARLS